MNYFEFYAGDYRRDTGRLSLAEHGAYLLLLADYYSSEEPLPADLPALYRISGAQGAAEQRAVKVVAEQFFPVGDDGKRHNSRADKDIEKAQKRINAARANGANGGRKKQPSKNPPGNPVGNPSGSQWATQQGTQPGEALHTPHAMQEYEDLTHAEVPGAPDPTEGARAEPTPAGLTCRLIREAGCGATNPSHPFLLAALNEGCSPQEIRDAVLEAHEAKRQAPFVYGINAARGRRRDQSNPGANHADRPQRSRVGLADRNPRPARDDDAIPGEAVRIHA